MGSKTHQRDAALENLQTSGRSRVLARQANIENGIALALKNDLNGATTLIARDFEENTGSAEAARNMSIVHYLRDDTDLALYYNSLAIDRNPEDAEIWCDRGQILKRLKVDEQAVHAFSKSLEIDKSQAYALHGLGDIQALQGHYPDALNRFNTAIKLDKGESEFFFSRGKVHGILGDFGKAAADFQSAISIDPDDSEVFYSRGIADWERGYLIQAISDLTSAISIDPEYAAAFALRGVIRCQTGSEDRSINDFRHALALDYNASSIIQNGLKLLVDRDLYLAADVLFDDEINIGYELTNAIRLRSLRDAAFAEAIDSAYHQRRRTTLRKLKSFRPTELMKSEFAQSAVATPANPIQWDRQHTGAQADFNHDVKSRAKKQKVDLPKLPDDLSWPIERFKDMPKGLGIVEFLERTSWPAIINAGFGELRYLRALDPSAVKAIENFERPVRGGGARSLPSNLHFLTEREVTDRRVATEGLNGLLVDPKLGAAVARRAARCSKPSPK